MQGARDGDSGFSPADARPACHIFSRWPTAAVFLFIYLFYFVFTKIYYGYKLLQIYTPGARGLGARVPGWARWPAAGPGARGRGARGEALGACTTLLLFLRSALSRNVPAVCIVPTPIVIVPTVCIVHCSDALHCSELFEGRIVRNCLKAESLGIVNFRRFGIVSF